MAPSAANNSGETDQLLRRAAQGDLTGLGALADGGAGRPQEWGTYLLFNRTGDLLVSGSWEGMLRFWQPRTGKQVFSTPGQMLAGSFSPDDHQIAVSVSNP